MQCDKEKLCKEKKMTENLVLLVGLLYKMCQIKLVLKSEYENNINKVNHKDVNEVLRNTEEVLSEVNSIV